MPPRNIAEDETQQTRTSYGDVISGPNASIAKGAGSNTPPVLKRHS